mmetsp:Transcript_79235/g.169754  ORF Transcript_79235/g.169754 Transcript_79235/m.169754 type:complete len:207 (-) Transcript_79235:144-764(-)
MLQLLRWDLGPGELLGTNHLLVAHEDEQRLLVVVLVEIELQRFFHQATAASVVVHASGHLLVVAKEEFDEDVVGAEEIGRGEVLHLPNGHLDRPEACGAPTIQAVAHLALEKSLVVDAQHESDAILEGDRDAEGRDHGDGGRKLHKVRRRPPSEAQHCLDVVQIRPIRKPRKDQKHEDSVHAAHGQVEKRQPLLHPRCEATEWGEG